MSKVIKDVSNSPFNLRDCAFLDGNRHLGTFLSGIINQNGELLSKAYNTKNALYIKDFK